MSNQTQYSHRKYGHLHAVQGKCGVRIDIFTENTESNLAFFWKMYGLDSVYSSNSVC